ncbi:MAG TPA: DUF4252 domain-containing protein [Opitutales bacterium]|nr:DUF4252 domain-containing protein [Opitutales bacterium]HOO91958.1 DUF4252 domain-containing protein [Opitutales bacterium]
MSNVIWLAAGIAVALGGPLSAQDDGAGVGSQPGYLDLDRFVSENSANVKTEVFLQSNILQMAARLVRQAEPEFAKMLESIALIRVVDLDFGSTDVGSIDNRSSDLLNSMRDGSWQTLVRMRNGDERTEICMQSRHPDRIDALAIVSGRGSRLSVVNIVGEIDLEKIVRLGEQFNIESLEGLGDLNAEEAE